MDDAMNMGMEDVDEEADEVYNQVLGEMGMEFNSSDQSVAAKKIAGQATGDEEKKGVDDLESRLNALKGI